MTPKPTTSGPSRVVRVAPGGQDFTVGFLWKYISARLTSALSPGSSAPGPPSDEHDTKILLCNHSPIENRYALRLRPHDNVGSVLSRSQKLQPM